MGDRVLARDLNRVITLCEWRVSQTCSKAYEANKSKMKTKEKRHAYTV